MAQSPAFLKASSRVLSYCCSGPTLQRQLAPCTSPATRPMSASIIIVRTAQRTFCAMLRFLATALCQIKEMIVKRETACHGPWSWRACSSGKQECPQHVTAPCHWNHKSRRRIAIGNSPVTQSRPNPCRSAGPRAECPEPNPETVSRTETKKRCRNRLCCQKSSSASSMLKNQESTYINNLNSSMSS